VPPGERVVEWFAGHLTDKARFLIEDAGLRAFALYDGYLKQISLNREGDHVNCHMKMGREIGGCGLGSEFHRCLHKRTFMAYV
jgi:hypothetical protein